MGFGGNRGGPGRPPSEVRERMRGALADRVHIAEEIADNATLNPADRLRALEFLARYGLGNHPEPIGESVPMAAVWLPPLNASPASRHL